MYARPAENLTITNSVFQNCWSIKEAGALYLQNGGTVGIHLINNTFINNTAYGYKVLNDNDLGGGAILVKSGTIFSFINSSFINNTANYGGGIVLNSVNDFTITNAMEVSGLELTLLRIISHLSIVRLQIGAEVSIFLITL